MIFGGWGLGILSRFGLTACSTVFPQTRLNLEVDILTEPLGVMDLMNLLCLLNLLSEDMVMTEIHNVMDVMIEVNTTIVTTLTEVRRTLSVTGGHPTSLSSC